ncbi:hypothetical protein GCM10010112_39550 [Actinoplanes lobatus]|uniref:Uncharacterized protein n=1 Tax=Actinoplanes lobatus TaxID=113568 RepID=A0A7W7MHD9_9ACTN|nr:hypothetical protein [Actinoplanes lobatus]MBB4750407.1 hypothetical protein [Actinoplanes lobatus]GGN71882.1 hypothetical protein GCM10010112_39550 [Actinoplanes lobatus]GIE45271.1 hypothetical protein Alo02nite_81690 [Actinoplanes lobatus]
MPSNSVTVRFAALDAPALMLLYGLLRLIDGLDGARDPGGLAWTVGHLAFFAAMVLFGVLAAGLRRLAPPGAGPVATVATAMTLSGVAGFLAAIAGDLSPAFQAAAPLPEQLQVAGPLLFALGMLTLLGLMVAARRAPAWSPLMFGAGIVALTLDVDNLPLAALILLAALAPLARPDRRRAGLTRRYV